MTYYWIATAPFCSHCPYNSPAYLPALFSVFDNYVHLLAVVLNCARLCSCVGGRQIRVDKEMRWGRSSTGRSSPTACAMPSGIAASPTAMSLSWRFTVRTSRWRALSPWCVGTVPFSSFWLQSVWFHIIFDSFPRFGCASVRFHAVWCSDCTADRRYHKGF